MHKYLIRYLADVDDANWAEYTSEQPVVIGDVVQLSCSYYHCVTDVKEDLAAQITVSQSTQSKAEAIMIARQLGHLPSIKLA
jgi:hypothetical protein